VSLELSNVRVSVGGSLDGSTTANVIETEEWEEKHVFLIKSSRIKIDYCVCFGKK
jgi:hypothetical protein